ncbi:hypothetical protein R5R35_003610 [Gryllus longicercus]|uniref:Caspase-8 n=1 Tax=Gryllus longicercus TaxID=2509291 RepID=A0AAN9Z3A2_9ORTH
MMANFIPRISVDGLITAADESDINSLVSSVLSMTSEMNFSSYAPDSLSEDSSENDDDVERETNKINCHKPRKNEKRKCSDRKEDHTNISSVIRKSEKNLTSDAYGIRSNISSLHENEAASAQSGVFCLNTRIVEEIEDDLQFYEKVSLVFLLYDSDDLALQRLKTALRSHNTGSFTHCRLLSDWALHETSDNWQGKFLEALSIIKNISWVKKLGVSVEEMNVRFLPKNPEASLYVDLLRKALYIVCESLTYEQLKRLQMLVDRDMEIIGRMPDRYDEELMEMNILHWMSQRYLNIGVVGSCDVNIKNLTKHLKVMEEYRFVDYLESIARRYYKPVDVITEPTSFSDRLSMKSAFSQGGISSHSVVSQCQEESSVECVNNTYAIDPRNVGFCVIINQKTFYKETNPKLKHLVHEDYLEPRIGTDIDRDRLCEIFMSFGFFVKIWENLTHIELLQAIQESATNLVKQEHSCFVLCILSHGRKNAVYGVNSIAVEMQDIEKFLHGKYCPKLLDKPKIIIVQSCQGLVKQNAYISDIGEDGASPSKSSPEVSDTLTFWSTVPGYAAFRDRITGSWFVRALWDEMLHKKSYGLDIFTIFVNVTAQVCNKRAPIDGELKAMTPQFSSCFRKKLIFPIHQDARKAAAKRMFERYLFDCLLNDFIEEKVVLSNK